MGGVHQAELKEWPSHGLEFLGQCPVCGSEERALLHAGLTDRIFFTAPGQWTMWSCSNCGCGYLDPRPNEATIGLAYDAYFTHSGSSADALPSTASRSFPMRFRAALGNGYRNKRFGTRLNPAVSFGHTLARLFPPLHWGSDLGYRFLPRPKRRATRVLDIGCGNGAWLLVARDAGCHVAAVEPDEEAASIVRAHGIEVRPRTSDWVECGDLFDHVTLSHVIEHVHDPAELLRSCQVLLRPGGTLFIETPNMNAEGHVLYGNDWRGLEPPRHLVLFTRKALAKAVAEAGFGQIGFHPNLGAFPFTSLQSRRIAAGQDPYSEEGLQPRHSPTRAQRIRSIAGSRSEFLTLTTMRTAD